MAQLGVRVDGLREFRADLKALEDRLPRELTKVNKRAAEFLAQRARARGQSLGSVAAKAAETLRASGSQLGGYVIGGDGAPYFFGAEFGAFAYPQFKPWRGSGGDAGYFVYPEIRASEEEVVDMYGDLLDDLAARAFPN
mgnify:CR=1 FL=1